MSKAIRGHNLGATMAMVLIAALLLLAAAVFTVRQATTTGDRVGAPAISADRDGGSSFTHDPYIDRHAEVIARYSNRPDTPAKGQDSAGGLSLTRDSAIERHAEVIARHNQNNFR
jgi:hypothetical protein